MPNLIEEKKTRTLLEFETGLTGKALTQFLRNEVRSGRMIRQLSFIDPIRGGRRIMTYSRAAVTLPIKMNSE